MGSYGGGLGVHVGTGVQVGEGVHVGSTSGLDVLEHPTNRGIRTTVQMIR